MDIQIKSSRAVLATDSAVKKLVELKSEETSEDSFLRMGVKPGGCSGYSYEMFFDTDKFDDDVIEEYDGVNIVVDGQSLEHIKGARMAETVEAQWKGPISGLVIVPYGYRSSCKDIEIVEASHPIPDDNGYEAARRILALAGTAVGDDLVLVWR